MPDPLTRYIEHEDLYKEILLEELPRARRSVWAATANVKETLVGDGRRYRPLAEVLAGLARRGVEIRLLHGSAPSRRFASALERSGARSVELFAMRRCVRVHFKTIIVDGAAAYLGSANLTGAGLGAKAPERRNFEVGIWTHAPEIVARLVSLFSAVWDGVFCPGCGRASDCPAPLGG